MLFFRVFIRLALAGLASFSPLSTAALVQPMSFGVLPYKAPQRLIADLAPLTGLLSDQTGRPVGVQTAKDYASFLRETLSGEYDILLTAPHFARLAQTRSNYQPIAVSGYQVQAVVLVPKASPIKTLADLRGKTLAMPSPEALIYPLTEELLRAHGLDSGRNITLRGFPSNQHSMAAPLRGDADAGVTGKLLWTTSGPADDMRVVAESKALAGLVLMVHARVPESTRQRLRQAILAFGDTPEGAAYLQASGHLAWLPVAPDLMRTLDPYVRLIPH